MSSDQVFPEIPLVLNNLITELTSHPLALDVDIDGMLLQIETVGKGFEAIGTDPGLHALPPIPGMRGVGC